ncbi:MAG: adenylosuccinate lyase [Flavobacteriales bacterium]|nr:adenylosuccinate lyase [Flavobacteriales bacterium]MBK7268666.1 adenylosuccinate lyase [Flavobacteriales bacterium]MBK7752883.1 adenylosuccinate lyase [Flavobacteriales bacterium]MBK9076197.1 adenylosuccinate lyase [Flavobacteriales bacterium]MBK9540583.1 adenylosuccinate lyase [Flavobacteriales bacterium]
MHLSPLTAISPIDGRYRERTADLAIWFSELALIRYRLMVELSYFRYLCEIPLPELQGTDTSKFDGLFARIAALSETDAQAVKSIERVTNHDVKAVEYWLKERLDELGLGAQKEFVHFGLTSQDINNTALPLLLKEFVFVYYLPKLTELKDRLHGLAMEWALVPMLARTHGQPASPTRLGKEIQVFVERLEGQLELLRAVPFSGKFGGATGNFNAHHAAYPEFDWARLADRFLEERLGLVRQQFTTQIEHYDGMAALFDAMRRINTILIDLCRDVWQYVSMDYFRQRTKAGEVGSSAMPHKVNPIDFENAEGNLGVANALFAHLSEKLPISRLQRDLTDSTVTRTIGVPMAHTLLSVDSIAKGLDKLLLNEAAIDRDLEAQWAVVAEGIQTILRRAGYPEPYERLKDLTRGKERIGEEDIKAFIDGLDVSDAVKQQLRTLSPRHYTGMDLLGRVTS